MPFTLAGLRHAARIFKPRNTAADKYPVSRRVLSRAVAAIASIAAVFALPAAASAIIPPPRITEFAPLTLANQPGDITAGPDGNLWFTQEGITPGIGRVTTSGVFAEYAAGLTPGFSLLMTPKASPRPRRRALVHRAGGSTADGIARLDPATGAVVE